MKKSPVKKYNPVSSPKILAIFIFLVLLLTVISLVVKGITLYQNRGFINNSYRLLIVDTSKNAALLSFFKKPEPMVSVLIINNISDDLSGKTLFQQSIVVGVPIDGVVYSKKSELSLESEKLLSSRAVFSFMNNSKYVSNNFNIFDLITSKTIYNRSSLSNIRTENIDGEHLSDPFINQVLSDLFRDQHIVNQKISAEVVNATSVPGLASNTSRVLENIGINVISITSSEKLKNSEVTFFGRKQVGVNFNNLFGITPKISGEKSIYDLQIILGEDLLQ